MDQCEMQQPDFAEKLIEQLRRIAVAVKAARGKGELPNIECAFCGHTHGNYGLERGHVRYNCPGCGNTVIQ